VFNSVAKDLLIVGHPFMTFTSKSGF